MKTRTTKPPTYRRIIWTLLGRCSFCGGRLWEYDYKRAYCETCERRN